MDIVAEPLDLPEAYGRATRLLAWSDVRRRLEEATPYWVATTRPDGRPHVVPKDGLWVDDRFFFGGATDTVNHRNLGASGLAGVHVGDGTEAICVEGTAEWHLASDAEAAELASASRSKYGYAPPVDAYRSGVWRLTPARVIAWTSFPKDATRFLVRP